MKKPILGNIIKKILLEQVAAREKNSGKGGKIVEEVQLNGFSEEEIRELEENINRDFQGGINIGGSKRIKIRFGIKWAWPPWGSRLVITITW